MEKFVKDLNALFKKHNLENYMLFLMDDQYSFCAIEGNLDAIGQGLNAVMLDNPDLSDKLVKILTAPIEGPEEEAEPTTLH